MGFGWEIVAQWVDFHHTKLTKGELIAVKSPNLINNYKQIKENQQPPALNLNNAKTVVCFVFLSQQKSMLLPGYEIINKKLFEMGKDATVACL